MPKRVEGTRLRALFGCSHRAALGLAIAVSLVAGYPLGRATVTADDPSPGYPLGPPLPLPSPSEFITRYDQSGDGRLSLAELFYDRAGRDLLPGESILVKAHEQLFRDLDLDCSGLLEGGEVDHVSELLHAVESERRLRESKRPRFLELDADGDGRLSRKEWLEGAGPSESASAYEFRLCDFDGDGSLSFLESTCTSRYGDGAFEPDVPDPIRNEMQRVFTNVARALSLDECQRAHGTPAKVLASLNKELPFLQNISAWDLDGDGQLDHHEVHRGLEIAYGIRLSSGMPLRRPNGQVFNLKTFGYMDRDHNSELSREEFQKKYWFKDRVDEMFGRVDANGDGKLTLVELNHSEIDHLLWVDSLGDFRRLDANQDALLSPGELSSEAKSFEKYQAAQMIPAFDLNGDGSLSLMEFRRSPFDAPILDWNHLRWDTDFDGSLSLEEYHTDALPEARALANVFFSRLDRDKNGRLQLRECEFMISWGKVPAEVAFAALDADDDGRLQLPEIFGPFDGPAADDAARSSQQKKLAKLENAFAFSDTNGDAYVSREEYLDPRSMIADAVGRRATAFQLPAPPISLEKPVQEWNWRFLTLIVLNVVVVLGLLVIAIRGSRTARKERN